MTRTPDPAARARAGLPARARQLRPARACVRGRGSPPLCALLALLLAARPAASGDLGGSVRIVAVTTDAAGERSSTVQKDASLRLRQTLSPYLTVDVTGTGTLRDSDAAADGDSGQVTASLGYVRPRLHLRVEAQRQRTRGPAEFTDSEADALSVRADWRPDAGPAWSLRVGQVRNSAEAVSLLGEGTRHRSADLDVSHARGPASVRYNLSGFEIRNADSEFDLESLRHGLRLTYSAQPLRVLRLASDAYLSRGVQRERARAGATLGIPLPLLRTLYALDTTPEEGELEPLPALGDSDTTASTVPRVEIGGANTFRNVGLELDLPQPVTRLELSVSAISDPQLAFRVYRSADNLLWEEVPGVAVRFNLALRRYLLRFPAVTDRYFMAVNVSVNARPDVAVTEVRALVDVDAEAAGERRADSSQWSASAALTPSSRSRIDLLVAYRDDESRVAGPVLARSTWTWGANGRYRLAPDLVLNGQWNESDHRRSAAPALAVASRRLGASLAWDPLPTLGVVGSVARRSERGEGTTLSSARDLALRARARLLPDLELTSSALHSSRDDRVRGDTVGVLTLRQGLEGNPVERLSLGVAGSRSWYSAADRVAPADRWSVAWTAGLDLGTLGLDGELSHGGGGDTSSLSRRLSARWNPGERLSIAASHSDSGSRSQSSTTSRSASVYYRLRQNVTGSASLSRSRSDNSSGSGEGESSSLQMELVGSF